MKNISLDTIENHVLLFRLDLYKQSYFYLSKISTLWVLSTPGLSVALLSVVVSCHPTLIGCHMFYIELSVLLLNGTIHLHKNVLAFLILC